MNRPFTLIRPGSYAYIRVRVRSQTPAQDTFGEFEVEPIDKLGNPVFPGRYLYAMQKELITPEEARRTLK